MDGCRATTKVDRRARGRRSRSTRTFAAAILFSCAVRPVSRLVLVSAERGGWDRRQDAREDATTNTKKKRGDDDERREGMVGIRTTRARRSRSGGSLTHHHDGALHALHLERSSNDLDSFFAGGLRARARRTVLMRRGEPSFSYFSPRARSARPATRVWRHFFARTNRETRTTSPERVHHSPRRDGRRRRPRWATLATRCGTTSTRTLRIPRTR